MFATPGPLPQGLHWRYEVHWAGLRVLAEISDGVLRLVSSGERDVTRHFPEFAELAGKLRDGVLDGEIVLLAGPGVRGAPGRTLVPSAAALQRRLRGTSRATDGPAALMVFDVLRLYGVPLLHRPLDERRATLERLGLDDAPHVTLSPVYDDGPALLSAAGKHRLRGVVAKRADSSYRPGVRDPSWVRTAVAHG